MLLYIERWLKAPMQMEDGSVVPRTSGTPQGGVVSPTLANLFLLLRDDLDENGGGDLDFEAAAGSGVMIVADLQLCKFFRRRC